MYTIDKKIYLANNRTRLNHKYLFVIFNILSLQVSKNVSYLLLTLLNEKYMSEISYFCGDLIRVGVHYQRRG
jgi:hypothetical protein